MWLLLPEPLALESSSSIWTLLTAPPLKVKRPPRTSEPDRLEPPTMKAKLPLKALVAVGIVPVWATASPMLAAGKSVLRADTTSAHRVEREIDGTAVYRKHCGAAAKRRAVSGVPCEGSRDRQRPDALKLSLMSTTPLVKPPACISRELANDRFAGSVRDPSPKYRRRKGR